MTEAFRGKNRTIKEVKKIVTSLKVWAKKMENILTRTDCRVKTLARRGADSSSRNSLSHTNNKSEGPRNLSRAWACALTFAMKNRSRENRVPPRWREDRLRCKIARAKMPTRRADAVMWQSRFHGCQLAQLLPWIMDGISGSNRATWQPQPDLTDKLHRQKNTSAVLRKKVASTSLYEPRLAYVLMRLEAHPRIHLWPFSVYQLRRLKHVAPRARLARFMTHSIVTERALWFSASWLPHRHVTTCCRFVRSNMNVHTRSWGERYAWQPRHQLTKLHRGLRQTLNW